MNWMQKLSAKEFDGTSLVNQKWKELIKEYQKLHNISFDQENDSKIGDPKEFKFKHEYGECVYLCQLASSGGDWECPVYYFRIQKTSNTHDFQVWVPSKEEGNVNLSKYEGKWMPSQDNHNGCEKKNESKLWKSLEKYLNLIVK